MKSYSIYTWDNWDRFFAKDIENFLLSKNYKVNVKEKRQFISKTEKAENLLHRHNSIAIQEDESKKYFILSHIDLFDLDVITPLVKEEECIGILKCQYRKGTYGELNEKVSSFTYKVKDCVVYDSMRAELSKKQKTINLLYFKGNNIYGRDAILKNLDGIINKDYSSREKGKVQMNEYLTSMSVCKAALSLPGHGNFSHRELEAFGMGTAVFQPKLINSYYNPLIPDYHYISVSNDFSKPDMIINQIKMKYDLYFSKDELLGRIASNANDWYENNIAYPANMQLMEKILKEKFSYDL